MIWSPFPIELILQDPQAARTVREQVFADGSTVVVEMSGGSERVLRLDATDPQLYLLPELTPGNVLAGGWPPRRRCRERPQAEA
jgi:hypothetical protein